MVKTQSPEKRAYRQYEVSLETETPDQGIVMPSHNSAAPTHATAIGAIRRGLPRKHKMNGTHNARSPNFAHPYVKLWYAGAPAYVTGSTFGATMIDATQSRISEETRSSDARVTRFLQSAGSRLSLAK
jgi:hypothetical protein